MSICKIATSKDHWTSPFTAQVKQTHNGIQSQYSYKLSTREKVIAIALMILTAPLLIGSVICFYPES